MGGRAISFESLFRGLYLENVTTEGEVAGKRMEAQIRNITVKHRLIPLLRGEISASEIVIEDPEVHLFRTTQADRSSRLTNRAKQETSRAETPSPESGSEEPLRLGISQLRVQNALITVHSTPERKPETVIRSLSLILNDLTLNEQSAPAIQRFSAKGEVDANEILIGKIHLPRLRFKREDWGQGRPRNNSP